MAGTEKNIFVQPVGPLDLGKSTRVIEEERQAEDIKVQHVQEHIIMAGKAPTIKDGVKLEKKLEPIMEVPEKQVDETTTTTTTSAPTTEKNNVPTIVIEDSGKPETIDEEEKELENVVPPHTPLLGTSKLDYYPEYEKGPRTQKTFDRRTSGWGYYPDYERPPSNFPLSRKRDVGTGEGQNFWTLATSNFLPIWFTVTMGTGTVPMVLHQQALQFPGLDIIIFILFGFNTMIFLLFTGLTITRYIIWPAKFKEVIYDPVDSLFIGTFPMGLATLINLMAFMVVPKTGSTFHTFLWVMWILDAILSVVCILYISFQIMSQHPADLQQITAAWLLPILPGLVSASAGGNVAQILTDDSRALTTILVCYVLIGLSFPLGLMVIGLYFARLALYKLPPRDAIPSTFLPIALGAQTALGLIQLGRVARVLLPRMAFLDGQLAGEVWYAGGLIVSLGLWASSASWLVWALASMSQRKIYFFSMGWWAFTFPLGIFAGATISLGREFASIVFDVLGSILALVVVIVWVIVFVKTLKSFFSAEFFQ